MKQILLLPFALLALTADPTAVQHPQKRKKEVKQAEEYVYVCESPTAYAYHKTKECRGLRKCTHAIKKVTVSDAKRDGRNACKVCMQ